MVTTSTPDNNSMYSVAIPYVVSSTIGYHNNSYASSLLLQYYLADWCRGLKKLQTGSCNFLIAKDCQK